MRDLRGVFLLIIFTILGICFFSGCSSLPLKNITGGTKSLSKATHSLNEEEEYYLGRAVAANILTQYPLWKSNTMTNYINMIGNTLVIRSDRPQIYGGYHFAVLNTQVVNAWSAPGGIIFLTRGLVKLVSNEDELAAVIAHEISHVVAKDPLKAIKSERLKQLGTSTVKKGVVSKTGSSEVVDILNNSVLDITGTLIQKGYSRSKEKKADLAALDLMAQTGYDPSALLSILTKLETVEVKKAKVFSAHPPAKNRIVYVEKKLKKLQSGGPSKVRTTRFKRIKAQSKL